jgi:hypothetical protein
MSDMEGNLSALTAEDRQRGFATMKERMDRDPAARVRQRIKAGRPTRVVNEQIPVLMAVGRLASEVYTGRRLMTEAGLNPDDITAGLVHTTLETGEFGCKWIPAPGHIGEYITEFEGMVARGTLLFLGILWKQRHTEGTALWVLPFLGGDAAKQQLKAVMNFAAQAKN